MDMEISFLGDENVLRLNSGDVVQHCEYANNDETVHSKIISFTICEFYLDFLKDRMN